MPQKKSNYFAIVREKTGRYVSKEYEDENDFRDKKEKIPGLIIITDISKEAAEKECREYNDRHFPIEGLEKWMI